jgi:hypothetical protein
MGDFAKAIVPDRMLGLIPSQEAADMPLEAEFIDMPAEAPRVAEVARERDPVRYPTGEPVVAQDPHHAHTPAQRTDDSPAPRAPSTQRPKVAAIEDADPFGIGDTIPGPGGQHDMTDPIPLREEDEGRLNAAAARGDEETKKARRKRTYPAVLSDGTVVKTAGITAATYTKIKAYQNPDAPEIYGQEIEWFIGALKLTTETVDNLREVEGARLLRHLQKIEERLSPPAEQEETQTEDEEPPAQEPDAPHPSPETLVGTVEGAVESEGVVYMRCPNRAGDLMTPEFCRSGCGPASSECPAWDPLPRNV